MSARADLRPVLAAGAVLAVLAGAYEVARYREATVAALPLTAQATAAAADSAAAVPEAPAPTPPECPDGPAVFVPGSPAARRPRLVRRYVGTVGGEPATALLTWQNPDSITGSFYLHRRGPAYELYGEKPKELGVDNANAPEDEGSIWRLSCRPGRLLTGTWRGAGHPRAIVLRENYAGGVRLAIETMHLLGGQGRPGHCDIRSWTNYDFPRLLDPRAVPPPLRPVLAPSPAARRRVVLDNSVFDQVTYSMEVHLNDFHLLSYLLTYTDAAFEGGHPGYAATAHLFDLAGGRVLSLGSQLVPGYDLPLRRLLARHLLHDEQFTSASLLASRQWEEENDAATLQDTAMTNVLWLLRDLAPRPGWYLFTGAGLEANYWLNSLGSGMGSAHATVFVPYAELRPLVRPGTPLAGMLAARGLW